MRLIDADALKFPTMKVQFDDAGLAKIDGYHMAIEIVRNAPTIDALQVVRCRQCAQAKRFHNPTMGDLILCNEYRVFTDDDGFCHKGAKMDGGADDV